MGPGQGPRTSSNGQAWWWWLCQKNFKEDGRSLRQQPPVRGVGTAAKLPL